jgi:hypothetical protein
MAAEEPGSSHVIWLGHVFARVFVDHGAVEWPDGNVGIATEALYALVHGLPKPETLEQAKDNERVMGLRGAS